MPFPFTFPFVFPGNDESLPAPAYARQLANLLPCGKAFEVTSGSNLEKLLFAIADELARVDARSKDLLSEYDPRTTVEMIGDWERVLGLPDEFVTEISEDIGERQLAVTQKYTARGGQSAAFFIALALACGYVVTISTYASRIFRVGARVGDRVYGRAYAYAFEFTVAEPTGTYLPQETFERVIQHATHSHITAVFTYS